MADAEQLLPMAVHEHDTLPGNYVRPESQRPRLAEVVTDDARIPVVDLASPDRAAVLAATGDACRSHGFFQVLNHGIHADLIAAMMAVGRDFFFRLPPEEKAKLYSDDPAGKVRLSTSFNVRKETVHNWRDYLRLHCHPLDDTMRRYCKEVRELGFRLCAAISDSPGLEATYTKQKLGDQEQHVAVNLYPECPEPELTSGGLPDALTILLMDHDVAGLQVLHGGGKWVAVSPRPGALFVSIGDQLRALAKRSRGLSTDAAVFQREPGARPRLGENDRAAALGQGVLVDPDGIVSVHALLCYSDGLVLPLESVIAAGEAFMRSSPDAVLVQVRVDESVGAKACDPIVLGGVGAMATGEDDGRSNNNNNGRRGSHENPLGILGIMVASLAVTAAVPAAAGAITPTVAFGLAVLVFTGVSMAMASVRGA